MAGKGESEKNVSESLKQCVESLASAAEALQKYASTSSPKVSTEITGNNQLTPLEEHRKLFGFKPSTTTTSSAATHSRRSPFYGRPGAKRQRTSSEKASIPVGNTWTHKFFLFASNTSEDVPTSRQKIQHGLAGLGDRDIVFNRDGNSEHVTKKLLESYPSLKDCGGFEIMRTMQGSCKILEVVPVPPSGYNVQYLKSILSQAKAYVRPIQKHLSLQLLSTKVVSSDTGKVWPQEKCLTCGDSIPIHMLRGHTRTCSEREHDSDEDGESYNFDQEPPKDQAIPSVVHPVADVMDLTCDHEEESHSKVQITVQTKSPDTILAEIMTIFPNKSYREVQQKFSENGSMDATVSALLEDDDEELLKAVFDEEPPALTFSDFRRHWCDNSLAEQKIHIDRQSPTLLRDVFKLYKKGLNIRAIPDVHFMGEDGSDASGPTREYFYLSMARLASGDDNLHLFEGEKDHLMPIHCIESYDSLLFYYAGLLISHSVLHEGYPIVGLSQAAVAYIVTGSFDEAVQYLTVKDIPDLEIRNILQHIRNAETNDDLELLNEDEAVMNTLVTAGFVNKLLNKENKEIACDKVMIHYSLMVRKLEMDDMRRGMEIIQLATVLKRDRKLWAEIFPRVDEIQVPAEVLVNKLKLHSSESENDDSEKLLQWMKDYVASLPVSSDDKYAPTTGRFLLFVFASPQYPTRPVYVKFNRKEKSLPDPEACLGILSIPTNAANFDEFKRKMDVTISVQAQGYGRF